MKKLWVAGVCLGWVLSERTLAAPPLTAETYNQWKEALPGGVVTEPGEIRPADGFRVELVRAARPGEGSWVAMAFAPGGEVVVAREDRGLLRLDPRKGGEGEARLVDESLEEVRGLLFAHGALYANANNSRGLYRLRDADGDGRFEEVRLLRHTPGGVGHGRNQLALGPDGFIYTIHGDDVKPPEGGFTAGSAFANAGEDRWLPLPWDRFQWSDSVRPPAGHVVRTDADGQRWEILCGGLRNPFGLAFNADGELFTYDADIEWDVGLPWYRPTRVLHLVSGADYGWRGGFRALPAWLPDTAPAAVDIGKGSPTAIAFGDRSHFPEPWRRSLYILDWAYGVVYAVDLRPKGASYTGRSRVFLQGRPLNVTGLDFGPDGALYFVTGGRRTQSALYRVSWKGEGSSTPEDRPDGDTAATARRTRQALEAFHGRDDTQALDAAWPMLGHDDPWVRQAARVAVEAQPVSRWIERALAEPEPKAALTALLAAARVAGASSQPAVRARLHALAGTADPEDQALLWARALQVSILRHGTLEEPSRKAWLTRLEAAFPHASPRVNRLLCELLCALDSPLAVPKSLALLEAAPPPSQEDALHILLSLRVVNTGWTLETRRAYLAWLARARRTFVGAAALPTTLNHLRSAIEGGFDEETRRLLARELAALDEAIALPITGVAASERLFQKAWTTADFEGAVPRPPDAARGRQLFVEAACAACHQAGALAPTVANGPDLTGVGQRFDFRTLLESMLEPWKVVAPPYRVVSVTLQSGAIHEGPVVAEDERSITVATNPVDPGSRARVDRSEIARIVDRSVMPPGLLNTFTREEVLDLAGWLQAGVPEGLAR
jgi:putative heme-binding domain-containing protein